MDHERLAGNVVPFARRWHVIHEIDLVRLIGAQRRRADLCDRLEAVGDGLPALPPRYELAALCGALAEIAGRGEPSLEAMLLKDADDALGAALLDHIRIRCMTDATAAQELIEMLGPAVASDRRPTADALGYMLRGFFTGCRRAIDFEQLAILASAGHRLTRNARTMLIDSLSVRREG